MSFGGWGRRSLRRNHRAILFAAAASSLLMAAGCARPPRGPEEVSSFRQVGEASWYGPDFHGKITANGERYNMLLLTAAHPTLPFNTLVRVTNLQNGRTAVVRINDRGPFMKGRILDLSYGAARALGANSAGVISVRIEVVGKGEPPVSSPKPGAGRGKEGGG
jgi:rare lipoprotein A